MAATQPGIAGTGGPSAERRALFEVLPWAPAAIAELEREGFSLRAPVRLSSEGAWLVLVDAAEGLRRQYALSEVPPLLLLGESGGPLPLRVYCSSRNRTLHPAA